MSIDFGKAFGIHGQALQLRSYQAELSSTNLANADTPGYQARTIDFAGVLQREEQSFVLEVSSAGHMGAAKPGRPAQHELLYRVPLQPSIDGNTVDAHLEKSHFMDNALRYNAELTFLNGRINGLMTAIRGE